MRTGRHARIRTRADVPLAFGQGVTVPARVFTFEGLRDGREHIAIGLGRFDRPSGGVPRVRVHSECLTGDLFGSRRCDCGPQLEESLLRIASAGGYLIYLRQEGRGTGLYAKLDAYRLQDQGLDTYAANRALGYDEDQREYSVAAQMLVALGVTRLDLLTGNPDKVADLAAGGVRVRSVLPTGRHETPENVRYLEARKARGHSFVAAAHGLLTEAGRSS
jgi:GTP cyclohydrolase II